MSIRHGKMVTHCEGLLSIDIYNLINMCLPGATWQTKYIMSPSAEDPWRPY